MFTKDVIKDVYKGQIIGKEIVFFESATSTNEKAIEIGRQRENPEGIVVIADTQTHGRGRLGRRWISPPGVNLYFTALLRPPALQKEASLFSIAAAVSIASAIRECTGLNAMIKWPNDILINGRKAGGILTEMKADKGRSRLLAIGIGLNVNMSPDMLTENIRPLATSLKKENGKSVDRVELLGKILDNMEKTYKILLKGNKRALINKWLGLNCTIGNLVTVRNHNRIISGIADSINDRGELIIRLSSGKVITVSAGDVTILKNNLSVKGA
jgi:BirA family biotin operon repressor/biotin-[acetyl-CoA-carboxylase] ligase